MRFVILEIDWLIFWLRARGRFCKATVLSCVIVNLVLRVSRFIDPYIRHVGRRNNTIYLLCKMKSFVMQKYFIVLSFNMVYVAGSIEWSKMFAVEHVYAQGPMQSVGNKKLIYPALCVFIHWVWFLGGSGWFWAIFRCLPVRRNRRLHSTGLTINLTKPNNHPNSALNHLYSQCEWGSRAVLCILSTETAKCHSFAFRNHTFLPSKTMQCFKSNRAAHPQSNMIPPALLPGLTFTSCPLIGQSSSWQTAGYITL